MDLIKWNKVYNQNIYLDEIFIDKYKNDNQLFDKNCLELLVEIGEFVNETKVFKYWTIKKPDKEKMLEEYADIITMILSFYREHNLNIKEYPFDIKESDIIKVIMELYKKATEFYEYNGKEILEEIFYYTLYIGNLLGFKEDEILNAIENKQKIIESRLNSDY